jgi:hypothetical protein
MPAGSFFSATDRPDLPPRVSASFDRFGTGKTAVKFA